MYMYNNMYMYIKCLHVYNSIVHTNVHVMYNTRRMQCIVGKRERPNLTCWVVKKPSNHVKETL